MAPDAGISREIWVDTNHGCPIEDLIRWFYMCGFQGHLEIGIGRTSREIAFRWMLDRIDAVRYQAITCTNVS